MTRKTVQPLWTSEAIARATGGKATRAFTANGVSIDSRTIAPGDLFVALSGPNFDGHAFTAQAFAAGAAGALVAHEPAGIAPDAPLVVVADTFKALHDLGGAARARTEAHIAAVTGSVGKTSTKEALRAALAALAPVYASSGNLNNHWGVPLSLARMPMDIRYGVFELGMNHAGEIAPLAQLVRPHVAIITTIEAVHIEFFPSVAAIADAKAEIFEGLDAAGTAILPRDNPHFARLQAHLRAQDGARSISFGESPEAEARLIDYVPEGEGGTVTAEIMGRRLTYRLGLPGKHQAINSLAVLAAVDALGGDAAVAMGALAALQPIKGRGQRDRIPLPQGGSVLLIDESYNASPAAVRAALRILAAAAPKAGRRIAVLGDMRELGAEGSALHAGLAPDIVAANIDRVFLVGPLMQALHDTLPQAMRGVHRMASADMVAPLLDDLRDGDVVLVKGSLGTNMAPIVAALRGLGAAVAQ